MGRNRIPTAIQDTKGYFLEHPERFPEGSEALENAPALVGPPERIIEPLRSLWLEVAANLVPGVLKVSDAFAFETMLKLIQRDRDDDLARGELKDLINLYSKFGMLPSDRGKVRVEKPKESAITRFLTNKKC